MNLKVKYLCGLLGFIFASVFVLAKGEAETTSADSLDVNWKFNLKEGYILIEILNKKSSTLKISPQVRLGSINDGENLDFNINPNFLNNSIIYPSIIFVASSEKKASFTGGSPGGRILPPLALLPGEKKIIKINLDPNFLPAAKNSYLIKCALTENGKIIQSFDMDTSHTAILGK